MEGDFEICFETDFEIYFEIYFETDFIIVSDLYRARDSSRQRIESVVAK